MRKEDFPRGEGNRETWERWKRQPGQAAARGRFALFGKGRALERMVSDARSCEQGARSGRREAPRYLLSVLCYLFVGGCRRHACLYRLRQNQTSNFKHQTSGSTNLLQLSRSGRTRFRRRGDLRRDKEDYSTTRMVQKSADRSASVR